MTYRINEYCIDNEIWKPVPFYEGIYEASNLGRIRTVDGKTTHSIKHGIKKWKGRILKNKTKVVDPRMGYRVSLWKDKKQKAWLVSRLVALAFYGIPENYHIKYGNDRMTVNHIDGNRMNNNIYNLEWCTSKENVQHAFDNGLMPTQHKIILIDINGKHLEFRSKSMASRFLGRYVRYISESCLKKKETVVNTNGDIFKLIEVSRDKL